MDRSELINKILSELDLDEIYSFYNAFGDVSDPEYYKKIPSFVQYPEEWKNKPLTVDFIEASIRVIIDDVLNSKEYSSESKKKKYHYFKDFKNGFSIMCSEIDFGVYWNPVFKVSRYWTI